MRNRRDSVIYYYLSLKFLVYFFNYNFSPDLDLYLHTFADPFQSKSEKLFFLLIIIELITHKRERVSDIIEKFNFSSLVLYCKLSLQVDDVDC